MELCRCFRLRLRGCRCGQIHPATPHAPYGRDSQQEHSQQDPEPAADLADAVLPIEDVEVAVVAAAALPPELPQALAAEPEQACKPEGCQQHTDRPDLAEGDQRKQQFCRQQHSAPHKERPAGHAGCCCRGQAPPEQIQDHIGGRDGPAGDRRPQKLRFYTVQPADHAATEDDRHQGGYPPRKFSALCHNGFLSVPLCGPHSSSSGACR